MNVFLNGKKYDRMIDLQKEYEIIRFNKEYFHLKIVKNDDVLLDMDFKTNKKYDNIFHYLYDYANFELCNHKNDKYAILINKQLLNIVENLCIKFYREVNQLQWDDLDFDEYYDAYSTEELLEMAMKCAEYEKENSITGKTIEQLADEYYGLSPEQLSYEYELMYQEDYHEKILNETIKSTQDMMLKSIALKCMNSYISSKKYYVLNNDDFSYSYKKGRF